MNNMEKLQEGSKSDRIIFLKCLLNPRFPVRVNNMDTHKVCGYEFKTLDDLVIPYEPDFALDRDFEHILAEKELSEQTRSVKAGEIFHLNLMELAILLGRVEYAGRIKSDYGSDVVLCLNYKISTPDVKIPHLKFKDSAAGSIRQYFTYIADSSTKVIEGDYKIAKLNNRYVNLVPSRLLRKKEDGYYLILGGTPKAPEAQGKGRDYAASFRKMYGRRPEPKVDELWEQAKKMKSNIILPPVAGGTYEQFREANNALKAMGGLINQPYKYRILDVKLATEGEPYGTLDKVTYVDGQGNTGEQDILVLIEGIKARQIYLTNSSILQDWRGFKFHRVVYDEKARYRLLKYGSLENFLAVAEYARKLGRKGGGTMYGASGQSAFAPEYDAWNTSVDCIHCQVIGYYNTDGYPVFRKTLYSIPEVDKFYNSTRRDMGGFEDV